MLLLIDAYNLLHHSDALQRGRGEGWLEQARQRLLRRVAQRLGPELARETCLVFDARRPPAGADEELWSEGLCVRFAVNHEEADDLIEEIIARHPTPKRLTVISSDHRIQKAAGRRGATFFDADEWYAALLDRGPRLAIPWPPQSLEKGAAAAPEDLPAVDKPPLPQDDAEVEQWLRWFSQE